MAGGRTILGSLRSDDVTIPFWLRVAGVVVGAAVAVLVVVSAFTAGAPSRAPAPVSAGAPPSVTPPLSETAPTNQAAPVQLPGLPVPLTASQFQDPTAVAAAFATAYLTWTSPDGPPGTAARVEPYSTTDLFAHFPEPDSWAAPSAVASLDKATTVATPTGSAGTQDVSVSLTQHLLAQDGRPIGAPQPSTMSVTLDQQPSGDWLVGGFTLGS